MKKVLLPLLLLVSLYNYAQQIALNFAGDNDWVTGTNNSLPQGNSPRTIETWIKYSTSRNDMSIFNYGTFAYNQKFTLHLYYGVYIIGEGNDLATGYNFNDGNWHHLAVTHNGTTTIVYVDGIVRGSRNTTYNTTGYSYQMGVSNRNGSWDFRFEGTIDELRVWNVARTQQEIIDNMHDNFNSAPGLIAFYHLNDGIPNGNNTALTTVADATGNGNTGTLNNFALTGTSSNFVNDAVVLPVKLNGFTVRQEKCDAVLTWKAEETGIRSYGIESSQTGVSYTTVKQQEPANTGSVASYRVVVPVATGMMYYRLKIIEEDNSVSYSNTISLRTLHCGNNLSIYPNPASSYIRITGAEQGKSYQLFNSSGLLVQAGLFKETVQTIDIRQIRPGLYYLMAEGKRLKTFVKE